MIFKHLFTPKWKHPKIEVRLKALQTLKNDKDADVLKIMALEDNSTEIRQKALNKLNSLGLWWQAYKQDDALKALAEQHISHAVLNDKNDLDQTIKHEYVERYAPNRVLEKLVFKESNLESRVKLLKRLAQPKLIEQSFRQEDEQLQVLLLPLVKQYNLEKQLLKVAKGQAKLAIENTLEQDRLAKEKPIEVMAQVKMILAKLNALKEKQEYALVDKQYSILTSEWHQLELSWLDEQSLQENTDKFKVIENKISAHLSVLKLEFEKIALAENEKQAEIEFIEHIDEKLNQIKLTLMSALELLDASKQCALETALKELEAEISSSKYFASLSKQLHFSANLANELSHLPELINANQRANVSLVDLENIVPTTEFEQLDDTLKSQKVAYDKAKSVINDLPEVLKKPAKKKLTELSKQFKEAMSDLVNVQQNELKSARRKAKDVQRLLDQGRSKVAFGVFKGFIEHFERLTPSNKAQLESLREQISEQLEDIRDWQKYASAPKRVEMLITLDEHIADCDLQPKQRAELVKKMRSQWHELGRVDTDEEKQQAKQFDEKLELLFGPCRAFFAEQEQQRHEAQQARTLLIAEMKALSEIDKQSEDFNWRDYEGRFNKLNKQWRSAGSVDSKAYRQLNDSFKACSQPIYDDIRVQHDHNAALKQSLVKTAAAQIDLEDLATACDTLKSLQKQWQEIGFAGNKKENQLWQAFREHNDAVFLKRNDEFQQKKAEKTALETDQQAIFDELKSQFSEHSDINEVKQIISKLKEFDFLPSVKKQSDVFVAELNGHLAELELMVKNAKFNALKSALRDKTEIPLEFINKDTVELSSEQILIRLEILSEQASAEVANSERMAEQVAMLDDKLKGQNFDFNYYLTAYLSKVEQQDIEVVRLIKLL